MAEYHVGCGIAGIYAGRLNKKGDMWLDKSDVTDEALRAVATYFLGHEEALQFEIYGNTYVLSVSKIESEEE